MEAVEVNDYGEDLVVDDDGDAVDDHEVDESDELAVDDCEADVDELLHEERHQLLHLFLEEL